MAPLFGLAPDGVYRAVRRYRGRGGLLPRVRLRGLDTLSGATVSPLPDLLAEPSAVCSLLHFPSPWAVLRRLAAPGR